MNLATVFNVYIGEIDKEVVRCIDYNFRLLPELNLVLITDSKINFSHENIKVLSLKDFQLRLDSMNIDSKYFFKNPYKLCDLKPYLPLIYKDLWNSASYVGWCDLDILFSRRLIASIKDADINDQPVIGLFGHFTVISVKICNQLLNNFWLEVKRKYPYALKTIRHFALDEYKFFHKFLYLYLKKDINNSFVLSVADIHPYKLMYQLTNGMPLEHCSIDNSIIVGDNEFDYLHFQQLKVVWASNNKPKLFYIDKIGNIVLSDIDELKIYNRFNKNFFKNNIKRIRNYIKNHGLKPRPRLY